MYKKTNEDKAVKELISYERRKTRDALIKEINDANRRADPTSQLVHYLRQFEILDKTINDPNSTPDQVAKATSQREFTLKNINDWTKVFAEVILNKKIVDIQNKR